MSLIKLKNNALSNLTSFTGSASLGDMVFISSATASASATIDFSLGNYKEYKFFFVNIHPSAADSYFQMNFSTDNGSNYNITKTTTFFLAQHGEDDSGASLGYQTANDLAQSTSFQNLNAPTGNQDADKNISGYLTLFNPNSAIYVKHFMSVSSNLDMSNYNTSVYTAGYANTTSALTNIRFKFSSGNIDEGKILMFGLN